VMVLSPVIPCEQPHRRSSQLCRNMSAASGRTISDLTKPVLTRPAGTTSQQRSILPAAGRGTLFLQGLKPRSTKCSPAGGHHTPSVPHGGPDNSY
jgi:hypothetical protein